MTTHTLSRPASRKHLLSDVLHPNVGALQEAGPHHGGDGCQGLQGRGQWSHQAAQWPPQLFALSRMLLDNQHIRMVMRKMLVSSSGFIEMLRRFLMRSLLQPSLWLRLDLLFWKVNPSVASLARVSYLVWTLPEVYSSLIWTDQDPWEEWGEHCWCWLNPEDCDV